MFNYQFNQTIRLGDIVIGHDAEPFVIAELSGNHQQSYQCAEAMIVAAARAGAHAIKLQTYTADSMTLDCEAEDFVVSEATSLWHGRKLHELYREAATPYDWHAPLFEKARGLGLAAFSSPFDQSAVDFLLSLNVPCFKIASFENNDLPLLKKVAQTGKPVIMSCGMATRDELDESVACLYEAGCRDLVLLKCTSAYPSPLADMNLATMSDMKKRYRCLVGLSDHSLGHTAALGATALGASVIEKHFVLSREAGGVDAAFSLEPDELQTLVAETQAMSSAVGRVNYGDNPSDREASRYRRSIYITRDLSAGDVVTEAHLRIVRPGLGLAPKFIEELIGKRASRNLSRGEATTLDMFE